MDVRQVFVIRTIEEKWLSKEDLEKFFGKQFQIEMFVKVNKDWRNNAYQLRRFGYNQK